MSGKSFLSHALGTDQETGKQTKSPPILEKQKKNNNSKSTKYFCQWLCVVYHQ